jgi:hypothetical protein
MVAQVKNRCASKLSIIAISVCDLTVERLS